MGPRSRTLWAAAAAASAVSLAATANTAAAANASVSWCATTDKVVLTTCGDACKDAEQACVQYPAKSSTKCSDAVRNTCQPSPEDESCTFQCIVPYDTKASAWRLFVKDPVKSDGFANDPSRVSPFPAAPVELISGIQVPADVKNIQITGFDNNDLAKGSVKTLARDDNFFALSQQADQVVFANIDLEKLPTNFLPKSLSKLTMNNCKLTEVPSDVGGMGNLRWLNLSKNSITDLPIAGSKIGTVLEKVTYLGLADNELAEFDLVLPALTTLDLRDNQLTTFPMAVFNMTNLKTLLLDGNVIQATNLTAAQVLYLKRFSDDSTLGFSAGACAAGERQDTVLGSTVCVVDAAAAAAATPAPAATTNDSSSGSSSTVIVIVCVVAGAVLLVGGGAFIWHKRRAKRNAFYESVMDQQHSRTAPHAYYNNTAGTRQTNSYNSGGTGGGQSRSGFFSRSRSRAPSGGGRPSRAHSSGSARPSLGGGGRPSKASFSSSVPPGTYTEIAKYQEERQSGAGGASSSMSLATGGSRQRERAQINQNVVRIASQEINYTRTIAKGAFGEVWLAHYGRDLVAVKKLLSHDPTSVGDFIAELNLLASLAHPRVLALVGACWDDDAQPQDLQIVMEYMDSGDLLTVLRQRSPAELSWDKGKAAYCVQICEAVFYLHSLQPALIHRDIKSRNILIDARKGAKLSDFGESRERTIQNTMTAGVGTARWVAPEIILGEDYSELADIYSLGVLLTELDTHKIPFEGLKLEEHMIVQQVSVGKLRPTVSDSCPEVVRRLVHECLQFDPQLRPSAARVLHTLMASPLVRRLSTISDEE